MQRTLNDKDQHFAKLVAEVKACKKCPRMMNSERVIGYSCGSLDAKIMFIGEAPGRLGADTSLIPFHGDKSGQNFESLIEQVGISRYQSFITNAVLCNPKDQQGNNATPTKDEVANCSDFLKRQIDLVQPNIVVSLGATALRATALISRHVLDLSQSVRASHQWYDRKLLPAYHPGQRAMVHRSLSNQLADYQFIAESMRRRGLNRSSPSSRPSSPKITAVVDFITSSQPKLSYFALHKLFFLAETEAIKQIGRRITNGYVIRQKDGPYCVDLHPAKLKKAMPALQFTSIANKIFLIRQTNSLFENERHSDILDTEEREIISSVVQKYGTLSDPELKRCSYLTTEMRRLLRSERTYKLNMFNVPLLQP